MFNTPERIGIDAMKNENGVSNHLVVDTNIGDPSVGQDSEAANQIEHHPRPPFGKRVSVAMTVWLTLVWVTVFFSVTWLSVLSGLVVSFLVQLLFPLPLQSRLWHIRLWQLAVLVAKFVWDLVVAGCSVSSLVVSGRPHEDGIVRVETRSGNPVYMTILAAMSSMVPGTIVVKVDPKTKAVFLHVLDLDNHGGVAGAKREVRAQEERILLALAPNCVLRETGLRTARNKFADLFVHGRLT